MTHAVDGFAPALAALVRDALVAADVPSHVGVAAHALYDLAGQSRTVDAALAADRPPVLALWTHGQFWLVDGAGPHACFHCFQLWRLHRWTIGFTRDATPREFPSVAALVDAWVAATIAAAAIDIDSETVAATAKARLVSIDHRTVSEHRFIRHPDCRRCAPLPDNTRSAAANLIDRDSASRGLRGVSLHAMGAAVFPYAKDARTGLVRWIAPRTSTPLLGMRAATLYPFRDPATVEEGFGRSGRSTDDTTVALLEGVERFAGMRPRGERTVVRGSYSTLQDDAIDPRAYILHAPEQRGQPGYALADYDPDIVYDWVWGYSFRRRDAVLVPLQLAYFGLGRSAHVTGGRFVYEISNGCALGASIVEAALHGLLEVIERDAFLASWHSQRDVDVVDARGCADPFVQAMLARLGAEELDVTLYDIRCGLPPAAFAVRIADPALRFGPAAVYAAGAHLDRDKAIRAALSEAVTFIYRHDAKERDEKLRKARALLDDPTQVRSMADHSLQCWPQRALAERGFATSAGPALAWSDMPNASATEDVPTSQLLSDLVAATLAVATDVVVVDQSFAPLKSRGVHCAKVLAPGLLPMTFGHQHRRISVERLMQVAGRDDRAVARFRDDPHIFP